MGSKIPLDAQIVFKIKEEEKFRRLTGVSKKTFEKIVEMLRGTQIQKKSRGGRPNKL